MKMMGPRAAILLGILAGFWAAGCGGSSGGGTTSKTTPTVSAWPTASAITYGSTLSSSTLTGGSASVTGTFAWTTSSTAPGAGTQSEGVTFTPADATDYYTVAGSVERDREQGNADGVGVADGERDYLRADAGVVDAKRRDGIGERGVCLDDILDRARSRDYE